MLSYAAWFLLRFIYVVFRPFEIKGMEHLPKDGKPVVVVANHIHELDPWKIGPLLPFQNQVYWFAKEELFSVAAMHWEYRLNGRGTVAALAMAMVTVFFVTYSLTVPVSREDKTSSTNIGTLKTALRLLKKRKTVGIFGRGGIGPEYEDKAQPIFVKLAETCRAEILPVKLDRGRIVFGRRIFVTSVADAQSTARQIMDNIDCFTGCDERRIA